MSREHTTPLDAEMDRRRLELGLKWRDVARIGNISYEAVRAARAGEGRPSDLTQSGIERALQWRPGSVAAIMDDGKPTPSESDRLQRTPEDRSTERPAEQPVRDPEKMIAEAMELMAEAQMILQQRKDREAG